MGKIYNLTNGKNYELRCHAAGLAFNLGPMWNKQILNNFTIKSEAIDNYFKEKQRLYLYN